MDRLTKALDDHPEPLISFFILRGALKRFQVLTFPILLRALFSTLHSSLTIPYSKALTDITKSRLAPYIHQLVLNSLLERLTHKMCRMLSLFAMMPYLSLPKLYSLVLEISANNHNLENVLFEVALLQTTLVRFSSLTSITITCIKTDSNLSEDFSTHGPRCSV